MKRNSYMIFLFVTTLAAFGFAVQGCGSSGGSRDGVASTGTASGTGTGPNGTGTGDPGDAVGVDFTIDVPSEADAAWIESFKSRLNETQGRMWAAFEGQMYMKNVTIKKGGTSGKVNIYPLTGTKTSCQGTTCVGFSGGSWMQVPGEFLIQAWLHEWCHTIIGKFPNEEYSCDDAGNDICIMNVVKNPPNERWHYCDQGNCLVGGSNGVCWEGWFLKRYPSWKHPNTGYSPAAPAMNITVQ
ncbi:MAG: hypothetical protein ACYS8W_10030 [Planctomycetota bacterium]|jgi:hypothetical protein